MAKKPTTIQQINKKLAEIEKITETIAAKRDALRDKVRDLDYLLESLDNGLASVETGLREIEYGVEEISQFV